MSAATMTPWRPVYDAGESLEQYAARQRQAYAAFELAWREGRVSLKLKGYYDQLVRDVGANTYAWWTEERWAEAFGVSASTIKRVLRALTRAGLIRRERQFGASSRTYLTAYDRAASPAVSVDNTYTDNHYSDQTHTADPTTQRDIMNNEGGAESRPEANQNPKPRQEAENILDYRQAQCSFFGTRPDPTIGPLVPRDSVKNRHLTNGGAGSHPAAADPLIRRVLEREGVADFVLAPQLAQQAAGELQAVSQYLDTQHTVRDRPRLFAWLAAHGFGRRLLAGRTSRPGRAARAPRHHPARPPTTSPSPAPPERPPTPHLPIWDKVRDRLRADPAAAAIAVWLDDLVLLDLTDTAVVVGTPNVFVRDLVQPHAAALAAALRPAGRPAVDVAVVVDGWG